MLRKILSDTKADPRGHVVPFVVSVTAPRTIRSSFPSKFTIISWSHTAKYYENKSTIIQEGKEDQMEEEWYLKGRRAK